MSEKDQLLERISRVSSDPTQTKCCLLPEKKSALTQSDPSYKAREALEAVN